MTTFKKERQTQKNKRSLLNECEDLKELMFKYHDLPLLFMIGDTGNDGSFDYMLCHSISALKYEILDDFINFGDGSIYTSRDEFKDDLEEYLLGNDEYSKLSKEEFDSALKEKLAKFEDKWSECIAVYVSN